MAYLKSKGLSEVLAGDILSPFHNDTTMTRRQFRPRVRNFHKLFGLVCDSDYFVDRLFEIIDRNKDNVITKSEYATGVRGLFLGDTDYFADLTWQIYCGWSGKESSKESAKDRERDKDPPLGISCARFGEVLRSVGRCGIRELIEEEQLGDSFDIDEQMNELLAVTEQYCAEFTKKTFREIALTSPEAAAAEEVITAAAFKAWALKKPVLTVYFNGLSKQLSLTVFKKEEKVPHH